MLTKPELIELLLTNSKEFDKKFQELLDRVPNIHSPNKIEFFTHFFLGSILTLPRSELVKKYDIKNILFKLVRNEQGLVKAVKLFFEAQKKLIFITIITTRDIPSSEHYSADELKEIASKLEIGFIHDYSIQGKVFHIDTEESTEQQGKPFKLSTQGLEGLCQTFRDIALNHSHIVISAEFNKVALSSEKSFENYMLKLSHTEIGEVKEATKEIFKKLADIYQKHQDLLDTSEAAYHGFVYGFLAMNYKYKYNLDCYVERIAGKGYTDLVLISRKDNEKSKNWNAIPVVIEFKAGTESVNKAIKQIKDRGYLYTPPSMRTKAEKGVIVGVNFAHNDSVVAEAIGIYQSQGFIKTLIAGINALLDVKENNGQRDNIKNTLKEKIGKEIKYLYFLASGVKTENYLSRLILGQMLATNIPNGSKHIFIHSNPYFSFYDDNEIIVKNEQVSTFIIKKQSEKLIFNIIEYKKAGLPETRSIKLASSENEYVSTSEIKFDDKYTQFNIKVNSELVKTKSSEISVSCVNDFSEKKYQGISVKIGDVVTNSLFDIQEGESKDVTEDKESQNKTVKSLEEALFSHMGLIKSESHFQAVMQGLLMNQKRENKKSQSDSQSNREFLLVGEHEKDEKIFVFTEANPSGQGRIDLVVSLFRKSINNKDYDHKLMVIELKYAGGKVDSQNKFNEAKEQIEKYKVNLKAFSDEKKFTGLWMVFNAGAENDKHLIYYGTILGDVDHTSQSETDRSEVSVCSSPMDISENELDPASRTDPLSKKRPRPDVGSSGQELESSEITKRIKDLGLEEKVEGKVVRVDDTCSAHGDHPKSSCIVGSINVFINGKQVHRQGDEWATHSSTSIVNPDTHLNVKLVKGSDTVFVNGKAIARTGDATSCGAIAETGSDNVFAG